MDELIGFFFSKEEAVALHATRVNLPLGKAASALIRLVYVQHQEWSDATNHRKKKKTQQESA